MQTKCMLVLIVSCFCALTLSAADKLTPLNVKEGLWEITVTHSMSGMPNMPAIPPEALAKLPPEQRARMEAMMKGGPIVQKECITKEKLEKHSAFNVNRPECTRTVVSSTGSKIEMKIHCEGKQGASDGTLVVEAIGPDTTKGAMHLVTNAGAGNMNIDMSFSSRYLGPECGDVK